MRFAVDVGATTTIAAIGGGEPAVVALGDEPGAGPAMPSAVTWARDGKRAVGAAADLSLDVAPRSGVRGAIALLSSGAAVAELAAGPVPVVALVASLLEYARTRSERHAGEPATTCTLTVPVGWSVGGRQVRALRAAAAIAGLPSDLSVLPAPLAAAAHLSGAEQPDGPLAICDLGGSTCQIAVVDDGRIVSARHLTLGTDTLDESVYLELLRLLGEVAPDAAAELDGLLLNPAGAGAEDASRASWRRCQVELARAVRTAREQLDVASEVTVVVPDPVGVEIRLDRDRLAGIAERDLGIVAGALREQLARTDPPARRCVLIGGGASVPGFAELAEAQLDIPVTIAEQPALATALGAAALTAEGVSRRPRSPRGNSRQEGERVIADGVNAVAIRPEGGFVAAVARDAGPALVVLDADGRPAAEGILRGGAVRGLHAGAVGVLAVTDDLATLFDGDLRPLAALREPLAAALGDRTAWVAHGTGPDGGPPLLATYALSAGVAAQVAVQPLASPGSARRSGRRPRRPRAVVPSCAVTTSDGAELVFAVAAGADPAAQLLGRAGRDGLTAPVEAHDGPPWAFALARAGTREVTLRGASPAIDGWATGSLSLTAGEEELWTGAEGQATLVPAGKDGAWLVSSDTGPSWEAWTVSSEGIERLNGGAGAVTSACAGGESLWLVIALDDGVTLQRIAPDGALLGAWEQDPQAPPALVGLCGDELVALRGRPGGPRSLVALPILP